MGKLKQAFTINLDERYSLTYEVECKPLTDDEYAEMYTREICTVDQIID